MRATDNFLAAVGFITIIPVSPAIKFEPVRLAPYFPIVGLFIGLILAAVHLTASVLFPAQVAGLLDVLALAIITGGFHLDGLSDAADGLFSHRPRQQALEIMKDSRVGSMGVLALFSGLALKWACFSCLAPNTAGVLVLVPALARGTMLAAMDYLPYGRPEGGTGHGFFAQPLTLRSYGGVFFVIGWCLAAGLSGWCLLAGTFLITALLLAFYRRRLGCVTGDMLGAMVETSEAFLLLALCIGAVA